jgi:hypothetical protein
MGDLAMPDRRCRCGGDCAAYTHCSSVGENDLSVTIPAENSCISGTFTVPFRCNNPFNASQKFFAFETGDTCIDGETTYYKAVWVILGCFNAANCFAQVTGGWITPSGLCSGSFWTTYIWYRLVYSRAVESSWSVPYYVTMLLEAILHAVVLLMVPRTQMPPFRRRDGYDLG